MVWVQYRLPILGAVYAVTQGPHLTRAKVLQHLQDQMYIYYGEWLFITITIIFRVIKKKE